jgi:predicted kinase
MNWMRQRAIQELDSGRSVIADGTHTDRRHRAFWLNLAEVYSASIHLIVFDTSLELLLAAQRNRTAPVPNNIVRKYFRDFRLTLPSIAHEPWDSVETFVRR